jgi:hypothetical protein
VSSNFLRNVLLKSLALFLLADLMLIWVNPAGLGKVSLYNHVFPGRLRFPFGENSSQSYNLSLNNLDAMFASHIIAAGQKPADEYRVVVIGDSSTWGTLLHPAETLAGQLDAERLKICGKMMRVYNLGYPTISLTKDLMVLDYAMRYQPDLIIWLVTLEAFPLDKQLTSPIVSNNARSVDDLIVRYALPLDPGDIALNQPNFWGRTLIGQRRALADLFRLQMYGILWSATGIDQTYPADYAHAQTDYGTEMNFHGLQPPTLDKAQLAFKVLNAGVQAAGRVPVLLVNEPMMISTGKNSDIHYNFFYPRWAYDQWRQMMTDEAGKLGWNFLDLWNLISADQFTNSAIHLSPMGEALLAKKVAQTILEVSQKCP